MSPGLMLESQKRWTTGIYTNGIFIIHETATKRNKRSETQQSNATNQKQPMGKAKSVRKNRLDKSGTSSITGRGCTTGEFIGFHNFVDPHQWYDPSSSTPTSTTTTTLSPLSSTEQAPGQGQAVVQAVVVSSQAACVWTPVYTGNVPQKIFQN